jgi:hypothetical protein
MSDALAPHPRRWDTGLEKPYREPPCDFREVFLRLGQSKEIEDHYRTNWRCIRRWIEECGGDELRRERAAVTGSKLKPGRRSELPRRYVLGRTLRKFRTPTFFDAGLMEEAK